MSDRNCVASQAVIEITKEDTIPKLFFSRAKRTPRATVIMRPVPYTGKWQPVSAAAFASQIIDLARAFIALGLEPGDRLAIMASTSFEWTLVDYAAQSAGLVVVPIYETDAPAQVEWILQDTGTRLVITDTATQKRLVQDTGVKVDKGVWSIADGGLDEIRLHTPKVPKALVAARLNRATSDSLATIVYTSGTTGKPKGVELTQESCCYTALMIHDAFPEGLDTKSARLLLFLPLAHVLGRFSSFAMLSGKGLLANVPSVKNLIDDIQTIRPTILLVVPRVLEKIFNAAQAKAGRGLKHTIFTWSARVSESYSRHTHPKTGKRRAPRAGARLRFSHRLANRLVLAKIKELLGGNVNFVISGGAPLGPRLGHFYRGLGLTVLEGWGLTETFGPVTANMPSALRIPSVGRPLPGVQIRTDDLGQLQVRGPMVMRGYRNNPQATAEVLDAEGWFSTGDLGRIDSDGYVFITGRKKELIVTASGKNVAPSILEDAFRGHPLVSNVLVVGDQKPFIGALVTLDREMLPTWLANHKLPPMDVATAARHPAVLESLHRGAARASQTVSRAESIRKVRVLAGDFTVDNGLLTPSLKVKRQQVLQRYAADFDALYNE